MDNQENVELQYVDEFGNPIDPSLIDANGNYIGNQTIEYVDENGNPIDPSLIDANGNYIGNTQYVDENGKQIDASLVPTSVQENTIDQNAVANQLDIAAGTALPQTENIVQDGNYEGMVTFDYNNVAISDIVNSIILDAINRGSSDIHFDPNDDGIKVRIRIDGELYDYTIVPLFVKRNMITRIKIIAGMNITESRTPQDGAIRTELDNKTIDLRVSCLPTNMGEKIVIRIMDYSMSAKGIESLDFSEDNLAKVNKMLSLPNGIVLVTGATGTGKSTTVYSMLQKLNVEGRNLVTVEDPIEMNIPGINQVQAQADIGLTFSNVLRSILRQDPDVIMIGEIRDDDTAKIAVRASITGHLVLSTIHTNNSLSTIERFIDMNVERYLLGTSLSGIVSQKLTRRLCPHCAKKRPTNEFEKETFKSALGIDVNEILVPVGCSECNHGYKGRIALQEVLLINPEIREAISRGDSKEELRKAIYSENGAKTMLQDGLEKVLAGKTSFEEVIRSIDLEEDLESVKDETIKVKSEPVKVNEVKEVKSSQPEEVKAERIIINNEFSPEEVKKLIEEELKNRNITSKTPTQEIDIEEIKKIVKEEMKSSQPKEVEVKVPEINEEEIKKLIKTELDQTKEQIDTELEEKLNRQKDSITDKLDDINNKIRTVNLKENTVKPTPIKEQAEKQEETKIEDRKTEIKEEEKTVKDLKPEIIKAFELSNIDEKVTTKKKKTEYEKVKDSLKDFLNETNEPTYIKLDKKKTEREELKELLNDKSDQIVISTKQIKTIDTKSKNKKKLENLKLKIDAKNELFQDEVLIDPNDLSLNSNVKVIDEDIYEIDDTVLVNPEDISLDKDVIIEHTIDDLDEIINTEMDLNKVEPQIVEERTDEDQDKYIDQTFDQLYNEIESSTSEYDVDDIDLSILDNMTKPELTDEEIDRILDEE